MTLTAARSRARAPRWLCVVAVVVVLALLAAFGAAMLQARQVRDRFAPLRYRAPASSGPATWVIVGEDEPDPRSVFSADQGDGSRADIALLVTQTPHGLTVTSLPRDLLVFAPGVVAPDRLTMQWLHGPQRLGDALCLTLGIPVDHVLRFDSDTFEAVIDGLGGVDVDLPYALRDHEHFDFPAGHSRLGGDAALQFVRSRTGEAYLNGAWVEEPDGPQMRQRRSTQVFSAVLAQLKHNPRLALKIGQQVAPRIGMDTGATWSDLLPLAGFRGSPRLLPGRTLSDVLVEPDDATRQAVSDLGYTGCTL